MNKKELRDRFLEIRSGIADRDQQTTSICQHLIELISNHQVARIFSFSSFSDELDLSMVHEYLWRQGRTIHLPRIISRGVMQFYEVAESDELSRNTYGILEPLAKSETMQSPCDQDIILVPALAVDQRGYRLGYGGGFYDRYLGKYPGLHTVCPIFMEQRVDFLEPEPFDIAVAYICDKNRVIPTKLN